MSHFGLVAAHRLRSLDPEAALELAAELRNAVTPAWTVAHRLRELHNIKVVAATAFSEPYDASSPSAFLDDAQSIEDTVNHIVQLSKLLEGV
jgi:hypothetical protein